MTNYWCVNFDLEDRLRHGIDQSLWMMQYQYEDDSGNIFQGDRKSSVTANWRRTKEVKAGDWFIAYLPKKKSANGNTYFAIGQVRVPRKSAKPRSNVSTVEEYVANKRSHDVTSGVVRYSDAPTLYEDFDDGWSYPDYPEIRYAQRIDVEKWKFVVPDGIPWLSKLNIGPNELQRAFFKIKKKHFDEISKMLQAAQGKTAKKKPGKRSATKKEQSAAAEAAEKAYSKSQGFQMDSQLRKAIEVYSMDAATAYFHSLGYKVEDCSSNRPYDLKCNKGKKTLYVEVKGTQSMGEAVILTAGEVEFAKKHQSQMSLFLLHSIKVSKDGKSLSGGTQFVLMPWVVDDSDLAPISFKYQVP